MDIKEVTAETTTSDFTPEVLWMKKILSTSDAACCLFRAKKENHMQKLLYTYSTICGMLKLWL